MAKFLLACFFFVQPAIIQKSPVYPDINGIYTNQQLTAFVRQYTATNDKLGLVYSYAAWSNLSVKLDQETKLTILRNLLRNKEILRAHSERDYWRLQWRLIYYFFFDRNPVVAERSVAICDSIIAFQRQKDSSLYDEAVSAFCEKAYILKEVKGKNEYKYYVRGNYEQFDPKKIKSKTIWLNFHYLMGDYYLSVNQPKAAAKRFKAIQSYREYDYWPYVMLYLSKINRTLGNFSSAENYLNAIKDNEGSDVKRWFYEEKAQLYFNDGDFENSAYYWDLSKKMSDQVKSESAQNWDYSFTKLDILEREVTSQNITSKKPAFRTKKIRRKSLLGWYYFYSSFIGNYYRDHREGETDCSKCGQRKENTFSNGTRRRT